MILACGVIIGILFLEETHEGKRQRRDVGLELGEWILSHCRRKQEPPHISDKACTADLGETVTLLDENDEPPGYRTAEGTPPRHSSRSQSPSAAHLDLNIRVKEGLRRRPVAAQKAFTRQVILNIIGYGILA